MYLKSKHLTCAMTARDHANVDTDHPVLRLIMLHLRFSFRAPSLPGGGGGLRGEKPLDYPHDTQRAQQGLLQAPPSHLLQRKPADHKQEPGAPHPRLGRPGASQRQSYDREGASLGLGSCSSLLRASPPTHGLPPQAVSDVSTFVRGRLPSSRDP